MRCICGHDEWGSWRRGGVALRVKPKKRRVTGGALVNRALLPAYRVPHTAHQLMGCCCCSGGSCGIIGWRFQLEALSKNGHADLAYALLTQTTYVLRPVLIAEFRRKFVFRVTSSVQKTVSIHARFRFPAVPFKSSRFSGPRLARNIAGISSFLYLKYDYIFTGVGTRASGMRSSTRRENLRQRSGSCGTVMVRGPR